jgi:hypothetical protein
MTDRSKTLATIEISLRIFGIIVTARGAVGIRAVLCIAMLAFLGRCMGLF